MQNDKFRRYIWQYSCHFNKKGAAFMKSTGIVRKVDELGRIVLPIELRRTLGIEEKDRIEIFVEGESVILRKYQPAIRERISAPTASAAWAHSFDLHQIKT